jgi:hypothetical protein
MRRTLDALWSLIWSLLGLGLTAACLAGLYNVLRDDLDVQMLADAAACEGEGPGCTVQKLAWERGPIAETFEMRNRRQEIVRVRCTREDILLGEYSCKVRDRFTSAGAVLPVLRPAPPAKGNGPAARKPAAQPPASGSAPAPGSPPDGGP